MKKGRHKYRYYLCSNAQKRGYAECSCRFVNAQTIEDAATDAARRKLKEETSDQLKDERDAILSPIWDTLFFEEKRKTIRALVKSLGFDAKNQQITIQLNGSDDQLTVDVNMKTDHYKVRAKKLREIAREPPVKKTLILAHHIKKLVEEYKIKHPREVCPWIHIQETRLDQIMNTLLLSPKIQEEIFSDNPAISNLTERGIRPLTAIAEWYLQAQQWQELLAAAQ